jgi:hypothetical protein
VLKRPMNHSEYITHRLLLKAVKDTPLLVLPQQLMQNVIDGGDLELTKHERAHLRTGSFDFVIVDQQGVPAFAVDFDGPVHRQPKKREADVRKMSICSKAHLPIAKIDDDYLTENEHVTIVEFMVDRFWQWKTNYSRFAEASADTAELLLSQGMTAEQVQERILPPDCEFNFAHYYPGIDSIQQRLRNDHNLLPEYLTTGDPASRSQYHLTSAFFNPDRDGYVMGYTRYSLRGRATKDGDQTTVEWQVEARTRMKWSWQKELEPEEFRYYFGQTAMETNEDMREKLGSPSPKYCTSFYNDLPGLSIPELAQMLSEYKCLCLIEQRARGLKESGWAFVNNPAADLEWKRGDA